MHKRLDIPDGNGVAHCQVTALDYGDSAVVVSYRRLSAVGRVLAPRPQRPDYSSFKPLNKIDELAEVMGVHPITLLVLAYAGPDRSNTTTLLQAVTSELAAIRESTR